MATETQQLSPEKALELYKNTLNFNVISRYDPRIKQLLYTASHCVLYKFNAGEWEKKEFQGTLALYLRHFVSDAPQRQLGEADLQDVFCYGLILLNRLSPQNFSIGLLPNSASRVFYPHGVNGNGVLQMDVEINANLIILKNLVGDIYGLWVFDEEERQKLFQLLKFCLNGNL